LGSIQESPGKIGAIKDRFEELRAVEMRTRQIRPAQVRPPEIGTPKIGLRKVEPAQVEASQTGPGQVGYLVLFRPPCIPCCSAASENGEMVIV